MTWGWPFSTCSLSKLAKALRINEIADMGWETLRQILKKGWDVEAGHETWKASNGPRFAEKMARVLDLYDYPPTQGRVACMDEFGPLNLQPRAGRGWVPRRIPKRLRV